MQMIYQIISEYFENACADELAPDFIYNAIFKKDGLESQSALSSFFCCMNEDTIIQFDDIDKSLRDIIRYSTMTD